MEDNSQSMFLELDQSMKLCFILLVTLELFCHNHQQEAKNFLTSQYSSSERLILNRTSQIIADSVLTYCIVNEMVELADLIMDLLDVRPWHQHAIYPSVIAKSAQFKNRNWFIFANSFKEKSEPKDVPIRPQDPIRPPKFWRPIKRF